MPMNCNTVMKATDHLVFFVLGANVSQLQMTCIFFPPQEHYEAVMRRTLERSQQVEQRQKRWSWGGLSTDSDGRTGTLVRP